MAKGGYRPGAGRKKGSLTKEKKEALIRAEEMGILPLDYMLMATKQLWNEGKVSEAGDMASKAAPYIHRKMPQAIEQKNTDAETFEEMMIRLDKEAEAARKLLGD